MATHAFVNLNIPQAQELADLNGIADDLRRAAEIGGMACRAWAEPGQRHLVEPLSVAAAIYYSRAFLRGTRAWLNLKDLDRLSDAQRLTHARIRAMRDKHFAHAVNGFEDNQPIARYVVETVHEEGIRSVGCNHTRVIGFTLGECKQLVDLATTVSSHVHGLMAQERERLLGLVRARPIRQVLAAGDAPRGVGSVVASRKRLSKSQPRSRKWKPE
jgi:hypothetical protein